MIAPLMAQLMSTLHGYFAAHPDTCALDFPEMKPGSANKSALLGHVIRIFTDSRTHCDALMDLTETHSILSDYVMSGRVRPCPTQSERSVSLHRVRVSPRSQPDNRHRDINTQQRQQPPFLHIHSQSTGQHFSLLLERRTCTGNYAEKPPGSVNGYGLSSGVQPFYLPDLPL
jgi:CRISPR-associated protein Cas6/Csy4, subtype I-F/YPEST